MIEKHLEKAAAESDHLRMTPDDQSPPQAPQVLLIDLENCPSQIEQPLKNVQDFAQVVFTANRSPP